MTSWGEPFPYLTWYWSPGAALLFAHRPCGESSPCLHCAAQRFGGGRGLLTLQHFAKQWGLLIWEKAVSRAENEQWWRWYIQLSGHLWKQQFGVAGSSRHSHPEGHKPLLSPGAQELLQTCCSVPGVLGMVWSLLPWDPVKSPLLRGMSLSLVHMVLISGDQLKPRPSINQRLMQESTVLMLRMSLFLWN